MGQMKLRIDELITAYELREGKSLPLADLARETGLSEITLRGMVNHRATNVALADLAKVCDFFHCTVGELLQYTPDSTETEDDEVESRDIVDRWERKFGADERVPDA